jgi:hypothetical protein
MKKQYLRSFILITTLLSACDIPFPSTSESLSSVLSIENSSLESSQITSLDSSLDDTSVLASSNSNPSISSSDASSSSVVSSEIASSQSSIGSSSSSLTTSVVNSSSPISLITIPSNAPSYYQNVSPSLSGEALKNALDLLISSNVSVAYDWWRYESADESLTETNKVLTIYPRRNYLKTAHVSGNTAATWNREHSYPQSKISGAALDDNHHIFADDWKTNSTRGNYRFGIIATKNSSTQVKDSSNLITDNYVAGGFFEPNDAAKGEVARATLYLNTIYGFAIDGNFQSTELAILWALQYPPTNRDMQRNNRVYSNQGNRNPYIDSRDYICLVYGMTSFNTRQACGLA